MCRWEQEVMIFRCDLRAQYREYAAEIDAAIGNVMKSGRYTLADEVSAFESEFSNYLECKYVVGVANATDGLMLAMKAFEIGAGDEVITTPFTAIPTVSAIIATGAKPVFVDIDANTFLIDIEQVPRFISPKTKAIIPVHIFGNVVDIERLRKLVPGHIPIIEDAAQAHGSTIRGKKAATMGHAGVFSFYPTKNLGGYGDGGAVVTNDKRLTERIKLMRMYGMVDKDHIVINGVNSRLDELQAAVLRVKLNHLDDMNRRRTEIAYEYKKGLENYPFRFQHIDDEVYCNFHVFATRSGQKRDALMAYLDSRGIQSNIYYLVPLHLQKANQFLGYRTGDMPVTEKLCKEVMALPMYPELPTQSLQKIITTLLEFFEKK
jgi:dTDP-4-amino-4,6-dideoxygalactose transaminase